MKLEEFVKRGQAAQREVDALAVAVDALAPATPTRADYMAGRATFAQYYRAVAKTAGITLVGHQIVERVKVSKDEHLNDIRLEVWDRIAAGAMPALKRAFKAHGDRASLAGGVCVMKQAARDAAFPVGACGAGFDHDDQWQRGGPCGHCGAPAINLEDEF